MMGRQKRDGNHSATQNKLIQNSEGNEENRYPVPDTNKTKITMLRNPMKATRTL
jgi:hypothetical protein